MLPKKRHILCLDGGGTWALIQVKALMNIYGAHETGHDILRRFDLVCANSGGSIVAAGLALNLTLIEILNKFQNKNQREKIFSPLKWHEKLNPARLFVPSPQFSTERKLEGLRAALGPAADVGMDSLELPKSPNGEKIKILLVGYDYDRDRSRFFRSWISNAGAVTSHSAPVKLVDAVHASTNAPIKYFDEPAVIGDDRFWDGAIAGYNNPALAGVTEGLACGWVPEDIGVLSIGTGNTLLPVAGNAEDEALIKPRQEPSTTGDIAKATASILADPPDAHSFLAHIMLRGALPSKDACPSADTSVIRMNPLIQPFLDVDGVWKCPAGLDAKDFKRLVELDLAATKEDDVKLIDTFCELWLKDRIRNQSIRANRQFDCEIGFSEFTVAREKWLTM